MSTTRDTGTVAFERTAEGSRNRDRPKQAGLARSPRDGFPGVAVLGHVGALVPSAEGLARDHREGDLLEGARGERAVEAALVQDETGQADARDTGQEAKHVFRIRHLRHALGMNEACRLDPPEPRRREPTDELDLGVGREKLTIVLKPVPWADLHDLDACRSRVCHRNLLAAYAASRWPLPITPRDARSSIR
jgi:hypothetical protein